MVTFVNNLKTVFILSTLVVLLGLIGGAMWGTAGLVGGLVLATLLNFGAFFYSDKLAIATMRGVEVVNVADVPGDRAGSHGCGCATMSRNDPPHLVAILDLLRRGEAPDLNRILAGDVVNEVTASRDRLSGKERADVVRYARASLERMIEITERSQGR